VIYAGGLWGCAVCKRPRHRTRPPQAIEIHSSVCPLTRYYARRLSRGWVALDYSAVRATRRINSGILPRKLAIPPEEAHPQAEASATQKPLSLILFTKRRWFLGCGHLWRPKALPPNQGSHRGSTRPELQGTMLLFPSGRDRHRCLRTGKPGQNSSPGLA